MYTPPAFAEHRPDAMFDLIASHPLGVMVSRSDSGLFATHLPFLVDRTRGAHGMLWGHVARANPHHRLAADGDEVLVVFSGPDAYITPEWYATKAETGRVVPTWNYVAVHVHGTVRFVDDLEHLQRHLEALTLAHEGKREHPWAVADAPADYVHAQKKGIVGVEVTITRLEGKWKMSQNRSAADIEGVVQGLSASASAQERAVGEMVAERRPSRP